MIVCYDICIQPCHQVHELARKVHAGCMQASCKCHASLFSDFASPCKSPASGIQLHALAANVAVNLHETCMHFHALPRNCMRLAASLHGLHVLCVHSHALACKFVRVVPYLYERVQVAVLRTTLGHGASKYSGSLFAWNDSRSLLCIENALGRGA